MAQGHVYFVRCEGTGLIKIGHTSGPMARRFVALQCGSASPLELLGTMPGGAPEEAGLHARFAKLRVRGEWFRPAPRLARFIARESTPAVAPLRRSPPDYFEIRTWSSGAHVVAAGREASVWEWAGELGLGIDEMRSAYDRGGVDSLSALVAERVAATA